MTKADIIQQVKNLIAAPSCYAGLNPGIAQFCCMSEQLLAVTRD